MVAESLVGPVGIKGHAVAEAVAEAPKGVARALLCFFLLHPSFKTFYHTFHYVPLCSLPSGARIPRSHHRQKCSAIIQISL